MATRETRADRGRRRGTDLTRRLLNELLEARLAASVSQDQLAALLGWSQTRLSRFERAVTVDRVSIVEACMVGEVLGLELGAGLHPNGDPLRDRGHQAVIGRLRAQLPTTVPALAEALLPNPGDRRAWDLLVRLPGQLIGVEAETRIRDVQRLVRHIRARERDGGVDEIIVLLADTRANRRLVDELREALGPRYTTSPRAILGALSAGWPVPGSGVVLL